MNRKIKNKVLYFLVVGIFIVFTLGPIFWAFIISITPEYEMLKSTKDFLPSEIYIGNYAKIFDTTTSAHRVLFTGIKNSLYTSAISIIIGLPTIMLAGYAFSRYKFKGKNFILKFLMLTIVIPVFTTIIPIYSIFAKFGLLDNFFWLSVIYASSFIPINTWIMMNYFNSIPKEIYEAARVDGCSERQIFFKIILPLSKPIVLTCALMIFIMSWNQFQIPLILMSSPEKKVVTLILSEFMTRNDISYGIIAVCGLISLIIPAFVAVLFRNFLISGLTQGAVKE